MEAIGWKSTTPSHLAEDAWIGCGDCGKEDSQNHWISECSAEHIRSIRLDTKDKIRQQLDLIQMGNSRRMSGKKSSPFVVTSLKRFSMEKEANNSG